MPYQKQVSKKFGRLQNITSAGLFLKMEKTSKKIYTCLEGQALHSKFSQYIGVSVRIQEFESKVFRSVHFLQK